MLFLIRILIKDWTYRLVHSNLYFRTFYQKIMCVWWGPFSLHARPRVRRCLLNPALYPRPSISTTDCNRIKSAASYHDERAFNTQTIIFNFYRRWYCDDALGARVFATLRKRKMIKYRNPKAPAAVRPINYRNECRMNYLVWSGKQAGRNLFVRNEVHATRVFSRFRFFV